MNYLLSTILLTQVVILILLFRFYLDHQKAEAGHDKHLQVIRGILNRMIENQRLFVPVIDKMASVAASIWESSETRQQVLDSHERQEAMLKDLVGRE